MLRPERGARVPDPDRRFFFRAPPVAAQRLAEMGVNCVTLANNHALDFGAEALQDTLEHLRAAGIAAVGAGADVRRRVTPWCCGPVRSGSGWCRRPTTRSRTRRTSGGPGVACADLRREDLPGLAARAAARATTAVVVVSPHWGPNMRARPVAHVRRAAAALEAAGATLIAGHSAHVAQGASGRTLFDLGDFIDDYAVDRALRNDLGLLWLVTLDEAGPSRVEGVPLRLERAYTQVAGAFEAMVLLALLEERCAAVGSSVRREGGRLVFEME